MPRPHKSDSDRRTVRREIRLTSNEDQTLEKSAVDRGISVSDFLRQAALGSKPRLHKAAPDRAALIKGLAELGKIGSNVNQIAKVLNQQNVAGIGAIRLKDGIIDNALSSIQSLSSHLINDLTNGHHG